MMPLKETSLSTSFNGLWAYL